MSLSARPREESVKALMTMGLTNLQAKVYLCLVGLGKTKAQNICKKTGIARQDIYRILNELREKCLAEKLIGMPNEYKAVSIEDAVATLREKKLNEYKEADKNAKELLNRLKDIKQENIDNYSEFLVRKCDIPSAEKVLCSVEKSIDAISNWMDEIRFIEFFKDFVINNKKRNIEFRAIIDKPQKRESLQKICRTLEKSCFFELRYIPTPKMFTLTIIDRKEVGIVEKGAWAPANCLLSSSPLLIAMMQDYFDLLWAKAEPWHT